MLEAPVFSNAPAASTPQAKARFDMYSELCGEDGLPT